jgi:hypothetical protein
MHGVQEDEPQGVYGDTLSSAVCNATQQTRDLQVVNVL